MALYKRFLIIKGSTINFALLTDWDLTGFDIRADLRETNTGVSAGSFTVSVANNEGSTVPGTILLSRGSSDLDVNKTYEFDVRINTGSQVHVVPMMHISVSESVTA